MSESQKTFLEYSENNGIKNRAVIYTWMRKIDLPEDKIMCNMDVQDLAEIIIDARPCSLQDVSSATLAIKEYIRWLGEQYGIVPKSLEQIDLLDKQMIYNTSIERHGIEKKYISKADLDQAIDKIYNSEVNYEYCVALVMAIYEGIYSDSMDVIRNLKRSDVSNGSVMLTDDDGNRWSFDVSEELTTLLVKVSRITEFYIRTPRDDFRPEKEFVGWDGSEDACFKVPARTDSAADRKKSSAQSYRFRIRKMDECFGRHVRPKDIYISGIVHRINEKLVENGMTLNEAFAYRSMNRAAIDIIKNELKRSGHEKSIAHLRSIIKGHLDEFI